MTHPDDILEQLKQIKYDLSVTQTRVGEAIKAVAAIPREPREDLRCPDCHNLQRTVHALAEHRYNAHRGPVPDHYLAAERAAGLEDA